MCSSHDATLAVLPVQSSGELPPLADADPSAVRSCAGAKPPEGRALMGSGKFPRNHEAAGELRRRSARRMRPPRWLGPRFALDRALPRGPMIKRFLRYHDQLADVAILGARHSFTTSRTRRRPGPDAVLARSPGWSA
jgi:hypothetical protein